MTDKSISVIKAGFDLQIDNGGITSLRYENDTFDTQYMYKEQRLGDLVIRYRKGSGEWQEVDTAVLAQDGKVNASLSADGSVYTSGYDAGEDLGIDTRFTFAEGFMLFDVNFKNNSADNIEVGDLAIPFVMNMSFEWGKPPTESVYKHSFVSGDGSYMFWMRPNSVGPYLMMTPNDDTKFEYFDTLKERIPEGGYKAYIHSVAAGAVAKEKGTNWRQPHTSVTLAAGESVSYGLKFQWAKDYDDVRRIIVDEGKVEIDVVPGMVIPTDLFAKFSLKTNQPINSVNVEFPGQSEIESLGVKDGNVHLYQVKFARLGENLITVDYGDDKKVYLEFFATEPVETLIKKRGAFIAKKQFRDQSKWYNGLLAEWNNETEVMLGPDNYDKIKGWRIYEVTCDDPGLSKPSFLAAKNAEYPTQEEVEALDYYIENFVWGGLQMTTEEEYPYGIYGIPDWKTNRDSEDVGIRGKTHIWRIYDYPHIALTYWGMYLVAKNHPHIKTKLTKEEYLERAYMTALMMFLIPTETTGWSAYQTGLYNELIYTDIIDELEAVGQPVKALRLRRQWEKKVRYFVNECKDLFGSEYPFDSTGFESTHAFAKYAMKRAVAEPTEEQQKSEETILRENAEKFMKSQLDANLFCRGWLEPAYYFLGSDYRGGGSSYYTLTYMAQMGGWGVLDYALYFAEDPHQYLRLGYASYLSSWALMNTGTPETNYGFWFPGKENDGAAGGGFEPAPYGHTWLEQPHHRGSWYYSCEIDLGFAGGLRCAATVLADDPIFGVFCYGGDWAESVGGYSVTVKDGLRRRFHSIIGDKKLHLVADRDQFPADQPIFVSKDLSEARFTLANDGDGDHTVRLDLTGSVPGCYSVTSDGTEVCSVCVEAGTDAVAELPIAAGCMSKSFVLTRKS